MVWLVVLIALGLAGWRWIGRAGRRSGVANFRTVTVERGEIIQTVTANGALGAVQTVLVGSEVSGKIVELRADFNSSVTNGQVLARLDASIYERQLDQAQAELESASASLKLAEANFQRARELRELDLVSQADFDQAEASLAQARASLRMREASLSKAQVDLEKTTIFSPMDGVVISRAVDVGQTVAASLNAPTLFTLAQDLRQMRIEAQISEADVGGVEEGQSVTFTVDAYPARTFTGTVSQVRFEPVTVQNVVNYIAIVDVDNADLRLRPGMTANAAVVTARRDNVLRLPNAALRFRPADDVAVVEAPDGPSAEGAAAEAPSDPAERPPAATSGRGRGQGRDRGGRVREESLPEQRTVYVMTEPGILHARNVVLGITDGSWTEVLGPGLQEGESVVTGIQTATESANRARATGTSPFMPTPPRRGMR